ncbi:MAG TPA: 2,3-diphosphoglycerate-dependent phosphoglycerate mutase [Epsilonproteobacteria bacterium]|nr:2,3-diphosphoglycerate-dependent phosphoglycerate mutase [Campylobacterota bacterium]
MQGAKLILLRHGESLYNQENLFTGWTDVDLSPKGKEEAKHAGEILLKHALYPDICFTSWLQRSIHTAQRVLSVLQWEHIDAIRSWKLNERHYGAWQKQNKDKVKAEIGEKRFIAVRRGYDTPPPPLSEDDFLLLQQDPKYHKLDPHLLPHSESLKQTAKRTLSYFYEVIVPQLDKGRTVLVSAHGNSLRALLMEIEHLTANEIVNVTIPTGRPILYSFDETLRMVKKAYLE